MGADIRHLVELQTARKTEMSYRVPYSVICTLSPLQRSVKSTFKIHMPSVCFDCSHDERGAGVDWSYCLSLPCESTGILLVTSTASNGRECVPRPPVKTASERERGAGVDWSYCLSLPCESTGILLVTSTASNGRECVPRPPVKTASEREVLVLTGPTVSSVPAAEQPLWQTT